METVTDERGNKGRHFYNISGREGKPFSRPSWIIEVEELAGGDGGRQLKCSARKKGKAIRLPGGIRHREERETICRMKKKHFDARSWVIRP